MVFRFMMFLAVTVLTVADILAETIHNVFADDSVSAIFGDMNALF